MYECSKCERRKDHEVGFFIFYFIVFILFGFMGTSCGTKFGREEVTDLQKLNQFKVEFYENRYEQAYGEFALFSKYVKAENE